jgi:arylsulfatase A-like enzyme
MIASLDENLGELMEYLRESGLDENTLVFFISDNGGAEYTFTTDNGRYEGGKNTEFEGGVKVPMILRWKGVIGEGIRFKPMVSSMDIFTTALTAADAKLPARPLDGRNLVPFINDSKMGIPHEYLFWQRGNSKAVRSNEWKLLINDYSGDTLLYNLANNRFENPNLTRQNPAVVLQLSKAISAWQQNHVEPLWPSVIYFTAIKDGKEYYFEQ